MPLRLMTRHLLQILRTDDRTFMTLCHLNYLKIRSKTYLRINLFEPVRYPSPRQVIGRKLHRDLVPRQYLDEVHPHLAGYMRQYLVASLHLDPEHCIGKGLKHRTLYFYRVFFRHRYRFLAGQPCCRELRPASAGSARSILPPRQYPRSLRHHRHRMLKVRRKTSVSGHRRPPVFGDNRRAPARIDHRLYGKHHAGPEPRPAVPLAEIRDLRIFVQAPADAVTHKIAHHREAAGLYMALNSLGNVIQPVSRRGGRDPL